MLVFTDQLPLLLASAPPTSRPLLVTDTETLGSAVPVTVGWLSEVTLSPRTPVSANEASTGVEGAAGGVVSTVKANGGMVLFGFGASSCRVSVWGPSFRWVLSPMQTLPLGLPRKVP